MAIKKHTLIKWMLNTLWVGIGVGTIVLLVAAVRKKDSEHCKGVNISINGVNNNFFVDKKDIIGSIAAIEGNDPVGEPIRSFNLKIIEAELSKSTWIKRAELFFDNNETLQVKVTEREPVARIFTTTGTTFYIDTSIVMLPLDEKFSVRLPVFTDFPSDKKVLSKADSSLLRNIKRISLAIQKDSFCMALIDQVDITSQRTFEFVPKIGNNIIVFGDATGIAEKLNKIKAFYKQVMIKAGWNYYSVINVQYKNEIVAKRKGADDITADSLRTIQMMQQIASNAERAANDSIQTIATDNDKNTTDSTIIQQSIQRDDNADFSNPFEKPKPQESVVKKPVAAKPIAIAPKPLKPQINSVPVKKPVVIKPFVSKAIVPRPDPFEIKSKQNKAPVQPVKPMTSKLINTKPTISKPTLKKKTVSKSNNDY